ncbi:hypothetical protein BDV26DRAFT_287143 [Aspergillus bertholletiae]|uniref:MACPF-like domain-containing protein n=1 Tax=Aspergillus bertholletiae TaxID=1226010 RepID=A0A5N7BPI5_9EURO|nr:hypothetical protein BDV26DRAFT_287143 [Aspergillus bertholletiae]
MPGNLAALGRTTAWLWRYIDSLCAGDGFAAAVKLGGKLTSTHHVKKDENGDISEIKNRLKASLAASVSSPSVMFSGKGSYEYQSDKTDTSSSASSTNKLAWKATGGDTVLGSNPAAWAPTVRDYHNWRVTEISETVPITQILDMIGHQNYEGLFREVEHASLVSFGERRFKSPSVVASYDKNYYRLIFVNPAGYIDDLVYDTRAKEYKPGSLGQQKLELPEGKNMTGTSWGKGDKSEVHLFYQDKRNDIHHLTFTPRQDGSRWSRPPTALITGVVPNTPLAAGYENSERGHVPFLFFLRSKMDGKKDYPLYIAREDDKYQNHWYAKIPTTASTGCTANFLKESLGQQILVIGDKPELHLVYVYDDGRGNLITKLRGSLEPLILYDGEKPLLGVNGDTIGNGEAEALRAP